MASSTRKAATPRRNAAAAPPPSPPPPVPGSPMAAPRFTMWQVVGILAAALAIVAAAFTAGAAVGFALGQTRARADLVPSIVAPLGPMTEPYGEAEPPPWRAGTAYLGITYEPVDPDRAADEGLDPGQGARVVSVEEGSPAADAGLAVGDIILEVDGHPITHPNLLRRLILAHAPGDEAVLLLLREGHTLTVTAVLGARPPAPAP